MYDATQMAKKVEKINFSKFLAKKSPLVATSKNLIFRKKVLK